MNERLDQVEPGRPQDTSWLTAWREAWDAETQATMLRKWRTHLIRHGLNPYAQEYLCLGLVYKWENNIPGDD